MASAGKVAASEMQPMGMQPAEEQIAHQIADQQSIAVVASSAGQQTVAVYGCAGQTLKVVSLTGRQVAQVKIESPAQKVELNVQPGCYILKVGNVVRKVAVR